MIKLWENAPGYDESLGQPEPFIKPYLVNSKEPVGCVIVCPGGAYCHLAEHEGEPICRWLNSIGISAFCLSYRVTPYAHNYITNDILRAVRVVRFNAEKFNIIPDKIGVLGFSAGGHLVSSAAVHFDDPTLDANDIIDKVSSRPDFAILCYSVISSDKEFSHAGSFENLLGDDMSKELMEYYSNEKQIKENTPPIFLWHTAADMGVPARNSLEMAISLGKNNIPYELHIYPEGNHGLGLAKGYGAEDWTTACEKWMKNIIDKKGA